MFNMFRISLAMASLALLAPVAAAQDASVDPAAREAAAVKQQLEAKFPGAMVANVAKSPYFGLYEAQFDDRMIYTDAKVSYVLVGSVFDAETKQNLTDARLRQLNRVAWDSLPLDLAIKKVKGNGSRKLAIFSDADCPYCKRLESDMKTLDNVTIYTFLFPIDQLHPDSARKSARIWCSADRVKAWDRLACVIQAAGQQRGLRDADRADCIARAEIPRQRDAYVGVCRRIDGARSDTARSHRSRDETGGR